MSEHSFLSPSSSYRWLNCIPSGWLCKMFPQKETEYMSEGTKAHKIASNYLVGAIKHDNPFYYGVAHEQDMHEGAMAYVDYVKRILSGYAHNPHHTDIQIEETYEIDLNLCDEKPYNESLILKGTPDCLISIDDELTVIDYKFGTQKVEALNNPQLMLYAWGYDFSYLYKQINITIFQPRIDYVNTYTYTYKELNDWIKYTVKPAVESILEYRGQANPGPWCKTCSGRGLCRATADELTGVKLEIPNLLEMDEIAPILSQLKDLEVYKKALTERAKELLKSGVRIPGLKRVFGSRKRLWNNESQANAIFRQFSDSEFYEQVPLSPAKVEKLVGQRVFKERLEEFVDYKANAPILVDINDSREDIDEIPN